MHHLHTYVIVKSRERKKFKKTICIKCNSNFQLPVPVMRDNYPDDKYLYEIIVETGPNDNHATTSTINFILSGNECDTEVRFVCLI